MISPDTCTHAESETSYSISVKRSIIQFLNSGDHNPLDGDFPGSNIVEKLKSVQTILRHELTKAVIAARGKSQFVEVSRLPKDLKRYTRRRVEAMVNGLFPRNERNAVLRFLETTTIFVTDSAISTIIDSDHLDDAWLVANMYLTSQHRFACRLRAAAALDITRSSMNDSDTLIRLHRDVYALIDKALGEQDHELANSSLSLAECLGHKVLEAYPADAEACYLIALTWYHRWLPQAERRRCLYWLQKTLELAPTHPWAPLYMGYQYWDDVEYARAFRELARVDQAYFASIEHHWRNIKTRELMLCCRVLVEFPPVEIASLQQLVADYLAADTMDRPIPTELIRTLSSPGNRERFDVESRAVAAEMCRLIEGIGDQNVFPGQLAEFQSQCDSQ